MGSFPLSAIRAKGIEIHDEDRDGNLSVGDGVAVNAAPAGKPKELFSIAVSAENRGALWFLLTEGIRPCDGVCHHDVPWIGREDGIAYDVDRGGTISSVRFFGKCAQFVASRPAASTYEADPSLIESWSPRLEASFPADPFVSFFKGKLAYVAARHSAGIDSPTFALIRKTIEEFQPTIILLEGKPSSRGISPIADPAHKGCAPDFSNCGEPAYASWLAFERGIPVQFAEPDDTDVKKAMLALGYSERDLLGYYFLRRRARTTEPGPAAFARDMADFRSGDRLGTSSDVVFGYGDFLAWHRQRTGKDFDPRRIGDPMDGNAGAFLLKLSQAVSYFRDVHITKTIAASLNRHERVMVVYGSGHLMTQKKALDKMFSGK